MIVTTAILPFTSVILPTSLCTAAAAGLLAIWLMMRVGKVRQSEKINIGHENNDKMIRRMRAHANFIESMPIAMALIVLVELSGKGGMWLAYVAGAFILGRVVHAFGMDEDGFKYGRLIGTVITMLTFLGLGIYAMLIALSIV